MNWKLTLFFSGFTAFLLLIVLDGRRNIVKATTRGSSEENLKKKLFVQRLDASNFLKRQEKRSARSSEESDDRTHFEKPGSEYENITEEDHEEWDEREGRGYEYEYPDYYE